VVRLLFGCILFISAFAQAKLTFWTPADQPTDHTVTYVLPEKQTPASYINRLKETASLREFVGSLKTSENDVIEIRDSQGFGQSVLLIANDTKDQSGLRARLFNFSRHFEHSVVLPVGAVMGLKHEDEDQFYLELGKQFGLAMFLGGADKDPQLYGEKRTWSRETNRLRDLLEEHLIRALYFQTQIKIFGVCRGLQQVFTSLGGKLNQDILEDLGVIEKHQDNHHEIVFSKTQNGNLRAILEGHPQNYVDSHHHQSARENSVSGTVFEVSARSLEGIIEGLESRDDRVILVQFHPELGDNEQKFTDSFFKRLSKWAQLKQDRSCQKLF
jgi:gamma-glutamyl-gamma-aminobutyrate hydrolase PuuD